MNLDVETTLFAKALCIAMAALRQSLHMVGSILQEKIGTVQLGITSPHRMREKNRVGSFDRTEILVFTTVVTFAPRALSQER